MICHYILQPDKHISRIEAFKSKLRLVMHPIMPQWHHSTTILDCEVRGLQKKWCQKNNGNPVSEKRINAMTSSKVHVETITWLYVFHIWLQIQKQWTNIWLLHSPFSCASKINHMDRMSFPHLHRGLKASVMRCQGANSIGAAETHLLQGSPENLPGKFHHESGWSVFFVSNTVGNAGKDWNSTDSLLFLLMIGVVAVAKYPWFCSGSLFRLP